MLNQQGAQRNKMTYTIKKPATLDILQLHKGRLLQKPVVIALPKDCGTINSVARKFGIVDYRYYKTGPQWHYLRLPFVEHWPAHKSKMTSDIMVYNIQTLLQPHLKVKEIARDGVVMDYTEYNKLIEAIKATAGPELDRQYEDYKEKWDEESIKYCFRKGDLINAGTLDRKTAKALNRHRRAMNTQIYNKAYQQLTEEN